MQVVNRQRQGPMFVSESDINLREILEVSHRLPTDTIVCFQKSESPRYSIVVETRVPLAHLEDQAFILLCSLLLEDPERRNETGLQLSYSSAGIIQRAVLPPSAGNPEVIRLHDRDELTEAQAREFAVWHWKERHRKRILQPDAESALGGFIVV
ncbi:hypothetical protein K458DRAFT_423867 [Lentithecium fluviatile CBS 122367]|uniref:Uncharacterized protein n=1 Tax=Lentithecium fluviatile CBS 122367 TaxID=1168545 RepID=A0A6G1IHU3_9PLEO|nr:hypothetical protein K458DRAFT_423867 [Lentithecium fluviatile CBS 122367]